MPNHKFKVGDIVVLKTGTVPQQVLAISHNNILCKYLNGRLNPYRSAQDFKYFQETTMTKMYKLNTSGRAGKYIGEDTDGRFVLKMVDSGDFESHYSYHLVEHNQQYTVDVRFVTGVNTTKKYSFLATRGQVQVGDLVYLDDKNSFVVVVGIDTNSATAHVHLKGAKVATTRF